MIPKTIHYCWFGGNPLGPEERRCIASWERFLPDYEIVQWDESNFDVHCCDYVEEAYDAKKWAFVSDYARFKVLYDHGGLYFDTDVEIIRHLDDIIRNGAFLGCETPAKVSGVGVEASGPLVNPGLGLGCAPRNDVCWEVLESYQGDCFVMPNGEMNLMTVVERTTAILRRRGLSNNPGIQDLSGVWVYPAEYFSPMDMFTGKVDITPNTRSIHHYKASWHSPSRKTEDRIRRCLLSRGMNAALARHVARLIAITVHFDFDRIIDKVEKEVHRGR